MTVTPAILFCAAITSHSATIGQAAVDKACKEAETVLEASEKHDVDPYLLTSLIYVESGWNTNAVSTSNACGLSQVLTSSSKYSCEKLKQPKIGINEGARILGYWTHKYSKSNVDLALCAYNRGHCSVKNPDKKGLTYARKVLKIFKGLITKGES
mgnify:CR=1 FL=1